MTKTWIRFYTISDYYEEEDWLRKQHNSGWRLVKMTPPCFYLFESCEPEDVIYRLDFKNSEQTPEYLQMCKDFGWEYFAKCVGWLYFRKPASAVESEDDGELFSDNGSKVEMIGRIIKTRMLPLLTIFLCCIIPNLGRAFASEYIGTWNLVCGFFFSLMFALYLYLFIHCGRKLKKLKERYNNQ